MLVVNMELERKVHYPLHFCSDKQKKRNFFTPLKFEMGGGLGFKWIDAGDQMGKLSLTI